VDGVSDTDNLIAFLRAALDRDEQAALAGERYWHGIRIESATEAEEGHIRRWDPARVLAEVQAKRAILDDYAVVVSAIRRVDDVEGNQLLYARREARESDIRLLAQPYADQPGWRDEWRA
jgi:hypothetical protein